MKTSKLVMIATILAIGMLSITASMQTKANPATNGSRSIHITLEEAVTIPALVQIMYYQLNVSFLGQNDGDYTVSVVYQGITVYITGTYSQWIMFFKMKSELTSNAAITS